MSQTIKPDMVALWIAHDDVRLLPAEVLALAQEGLEIRACEDLRSFKKIVPTLEQFPDAHIVTADDDVFYPADWLERLVGGEYSPTEVVCTRAHRINLDSNGRPLPYAHWDYETEETGPSSQLVFTGMGGVLYPRGSLASEATDSSKFLTLCPDQDDIWLFWMIRRAGFQVRRRSGRLPYFPWPGTERETLAQKNVDQGSNNEAVGNMLALYGQPF